jgi:histidyl-tRNA synthetase
MYTFSDRSESSLTLRPEGTAPVCRAYLEHGMSSLPQPVRLYYLAPAFRYERPQAGRLRQHHQFGYEIIGDSSALVDAEVIILAWRLFLSLGLKRLALVINSIGCQHCRPLYLQKLRIYYSGQMESLCADCKTRLEKNPLRLLDCKEEGCQAVANLAPKSFDCLCQDCLEHFSQLKHFLKLASIDFCISHRLVRGLDYYTRTVFEIQPESTGAQSTIGGGGRYDRLIEELGGQPTPATGFATGIERIVINLVEQEIEVPHLAKPCALLAYTDDSARDQALVIASQLHDTGIGVLLAGEGKSLKSQLRQANNLGLKQVILVAPDELQRGCVVLRNLEQGSQTNISIEKLFSNPGDILIPATDS